MRAMLAAVESQRDARTSAAARDSDLCRSHRTPTVGAHRAGQLRERQVTYLLAKPRQPSEGHLLVRSEERPLMQLVRISRVTGNHHSRAVRALVLMVTPAARNASRAAMSRRAARRTRGSTCSRACVVETEAQRTEQRRECIPNMPALLEPAHLPLASTGTAGCRLILRGSGPARRFEPLFRTPCAPQAQTAAPPADRPAGRRSTTAEGVSIRDAITGPADGTSSRIGQP